MYVVDTSSVNLMFATAPLTVLALFLNLQKSVEMNLFSQVLKH